MTNILTILRARERVLKTELDQITGRIDELKALIGLVEDGPRDPPGNFGGDVGDNEAGSQITAATWAADVKTELTSRKTQKGKKS